jgi:hypothetical protein
MFLQNIHVYLPVHPPSQPKDNIDIFISDLTYVVVLLYDAKVEGKERLGVGLRLVPA